MKKKHFLAAMYLRLSRDDEDKDSKAGKTGMVKSESNSIGSQRELIRAFVMEQSDMELYDIYVDDGFSGSNFERPEFKRMLADIESGRVNCVIVKDLSRFGRDYIEAGRYIQKIFPALGVRFIALTDHYDSDSADMSETSILLPVKNFINDSYCRDISAKVKSQLEVKRRNGEYIASFAVYGYKKSAEDRNRLEPDEYAAEIVRRIYRWKIEGMATAAIAEKLNELGILSPREYKISLGMHFYGGFSGIGSSLWSSATVKRILTDEVYLGHLLQGKTEKVNYKVKKIRAKPKEEWVKVENTHKPLISEDDFEIVQQLLKTDGRKSPKTGESSLFAGLLFCADCGEQMVRRVTCYKGAEKVYYICSTKNRGEGCSRHSIEEGELKEIAGSSIRRFANAFLSKREKFEPEEKVEKNYDTIIPYDKEAERLKKERKKYHDLCAGLCRDLKKGIIDKEEFENLYKSFSKKEEELEKAIKGQDQFIREILEKGVLSERRLKFFREYAELRKVDRCTLRSMVRQIRVYEDRKIEIEFRFTDQFKTMSDFNRRISEEDESIRTAERRA
ncbi:recombinase [bacterium 1XD8-76]|nr:recombinase [bacterium 1XD8-76]